MGWIAGYIAGAIACLVTAATRVPAAAAETVVPVVPPSTMPLLSIGLELPGRPGSALTTLATDKGTGTGVLAVAGQDGDFAYALLGSGFQTLSNIEGALRGEFLVTSHGAPSRLSFYVTQQNLTVSPYFIQAGFNTPTLANASVTQTTYLGYANELYGGTPMEQISFTQGPNGLVHTPYPGGYILTGTPAPFSVTIRFDIDFAGGNGLAQSITPLFALPRPVVVNPPSVPPSGPTAVPEPSTWGLMIAGCGVVGSMIRRRAAWTAVRE